MGWWVAGEIDVCERKCAQVFIVEPKCEYVGVHHTILGNFVHIGNFPSLKILEGIKQCLRIMGWFVTCFGISHLVTSPDPSPLSVPHALWTQHPWNLQVPPSPRLLSLHPPPSVLALLHSHTLCWLVAGPSPTLNTAGKAILSWIRWSTFGAAARDQDTGPRDWTSGTPDWTVITLGA